MRKSKNKSSLHVPVLFNERPANEIDKEQARWTPTIDGRYWITLSVASVLGTNTGDHAAEIAGLGHLSGLPSAIVFGVLASIAIVFLGRRHLWTTPLAYWAILALLRTAGTGGGDTLSWLLGSLLRSAGVGRTDVPSYVVGIGPATIVSGSTFLALLWAFYAKSQPRAHPAPVSGPR